VSKIQHMTNSQSMLPCNTFAYWNNNNTCPKSIRTFIDLHGREGRANYFSDKSPNELHDMKGLVHVSEVYRVCW
jgi:hypothetical protein